MKNRHRVLESQLNGSVLVTVAIVLCATLFVTLGLGIFRFTPSFNSDDQKAELPKPPKFAYLISGTKGDEIRVRRLLQSVYHASNYYLLHLDFEVSSEERNELAEYVMSEPTLLKFGNVRVIGDADLVTLKGPTMIASTLHAIAILLKQWKNWDWFINLSASDYPLMSQDDLLHVFSYLPKDLNFIEHTSNIGWKENERARPIIVDPGLYSSNRTNVLWTNERRSTPVSFKVFVGSSWVVLSRSFLEFCIWGWDNLPRTLLMYYTNFLSSSEAYFHSVICNSKDFQNTTINHDLRYILWDNPPHQHPITLRVKHFDGMVKSGAPFAREFAERDPVLTRIDRELLKRSNGRFTPGGWCIGNSWFGRDPCSRHGRPDVIRPTVSSNKLQRLLLSVLSQENFRTKQCK